MKRAFVLTLALILCLCGCAANTDPDQTEATGVAETSDPGLYVTGSAVEQQTQGAVRRYDLTAQYNGVTQIGDKLLLVARAEKLKFTELIGSDCAIGSTVEIPLNSVWVTTQTGLVYYDSDKEEIVFLDSQLKHLKTVKIPDEVEGNPVISADAGSVFYCTAQEIRVLETEHKISRLLKMHSGSDQSLIGCYFGGTVLACSFTDADGRVSTEFVSAENGQTIATDNEISNLFTCGDAYFALRQDGIVQQKIIGTRNESCQLLLGDGQTFSALEMDGMVSSTPTEAGFTMDFFAVPEGRRTNTLQVEGFSLPSSVLADRWNGLVWILTDDTANCKQVLLSWNIAKSQVNDEAIYTGPFYTIESPDLEGLNGCQTRVEQINKDYTVAIRIWQDAVKNTNGYTFVPEHQVGAINKTLDEIERVLQMLPTRFLQNISVKRIRILVVRSINSAVSSTFYWQNSDPTIVLCTGADVFLGLAKGLGYVIDSKIVGDDETYSGWDSLNPEGFVYGGNETYSMEYLAGANRVFLSESAMNSAMEDRSQIFCQALRPDQAESFSSEAMQRKLKLLCQNIRNVWNLTKKSETYPWEQYLTESIAYQG